MEQMTNENEQRMMKDEIDYIDIPAFVRSMLRYARKYILLVVPLIICMSVCLSILSRPYAKKNYVAGGTAMIGFKLANSESFDYTISGLSWDRHSTMAQMDYVLNALINSGYINQFVRDFMGGNRNEELNGQIYINTVYATNMVDISVASESLEDAREIRDAVFSCLPDAVFPAVGFIEMDIEELYAREETSSRAFLTSPAIWVAGGTTLGIIVYLGLVFLYTLRRRDVETPEDVRRTTDLPCLGRLPALKKRRRFRKSGNTDELDDSLVVTQEYQRSFDRFRRTVAEEIQKRQSRVVLLTSCGHRTGQSTIAADLGKVLSEMGKKVVLLNLALEKKRLTEEKIGSYLEHTLQKADIILVDGPSNDHLADLLILADCADLMITVIREGQSQPDELKEMFQSLQYVNARPLGYVLNMCSNTMI